MTRARGWRRRLALLSSLLPGAAGALGFGPPVVVSYPLNTNVNNQVLASALGDVNGDGRADIALYTAGFGSPDPHDDVRFMVLEQQPNRSFGMVANFQVPTGGAAGDYDPISIDLCDLDGDHRAELLSGRSRPRDLAILRRDPAGSSYSLAAALPSPVARIYQVTCRDIDGDGNADILANSNMTGVVLWRGHGDLSFDAPVYSMTFPAERATLGDVDGDGRPDLLTAYMYGLGAVGYGIGAPGSRFFGPVRAESIHRDASAVVPIDLDADGVPELVDAHNDVVTIDYIQWRYFTLTANRRQPGGDYLPVSSLRGRDNSQIEPAYTLDVVDLDKDGKPELVAFLATNVDIHRFQGLQGSLVATVPLPMAAMPAKPDMSEIQDIDGDGCLDLGVARDYAYVVAFQNCTQAAAGTATKSNPIRRAWRVLFRRKP